MTTGSDSSSTTTKQGGGMGQAILLIVLLFIGFAFGGYYLGTQAKFNSMAANPNASGMPSIPFLDPSSGLKKWYWIHTKGWERAGYHTTVLINGQLVGKFFKPDVDVDVTRFVKPGRNTIAYSAKSLPITQRDDTSSAYLTIQLKSAEKKPNQENKFEGGDVLVEYTRKVTDTENYNDLNEFETIE